jgi:predicted translin family RNA/ssDNA-binding protein
MYNLLSEKLQRLRRDWAIQAGSAIAFQLEKEIEQAEAERANIEKRLKELEE